MATKHQVAMKINRAIFYFYLILQKRAEEYVDDVFFFCLDTHGYVTYDTFLLLIMIIHMELSENDLRVPILNINRTRIAVTGKARIFPLPRVRVMKTIVLK